MEKTIKLISNLSSLVGLLLFLYSLGSFGQLQLTNWQWAFVSISFIVSIGYILYELCSGPTKYKTPEQIKKYMQSWISKPGRTVIFTRDMTWVNDNVTKDKLREKARNNELIIYHPKLIDFTMELKALGAEIYEYPTLNFTPKSRFTFINYNTASSKVAIGKTDKNHVHYIEESSYDNIQYFLAEDLINLIKTLQ